MFSKRKMSDCIENCSDNMERAARAIAEANAIVVGIGAGMSASAGMSYSGERFEKYLESLRSIDIENFTEHYADLKYFEAKTGRRPNDKERTSVSYCFVLLLNEVISKFFFC